MPDILYAYLWPYVSTGIYQAYSIFLLNYVVGEKWRSWSCNTLQRWFNSQSVSLLGCLNIHRGSYLRRDVVFPIISSGPVFSHAGNHPVWLSKNVKNRILCALYGRENLLLRRNLLILTISQHVFLKLYICVINRSLPKYSSSHRPIQVLTYPVINMRLGLFFSRTILIIDCI